MPKFQLRQLSAELTAANRSFVVVSRCFGRSSHSVVAWSRLKHNEQCSLVFAFTKAIA